MGEDRDGTTQSPGFNARGRERRRNRRVKSPELRCHFGEVVDMSAAGLRVCCKGPTTVQVGDAFSAHLQHDRLDIELTIKATVSWVENLGIRRFSVGLELIELSEADQLQLEIIVAAGHDEFTGPQLWIAS
jgi:hypothetical protein